MVFFPVFVKLRDILGRQSCRVFFSLCNRPPINTFEGRPLSSPKQDLLPRIEVYVKIPSRMRRINLLIGLLITIVMAGLMLMEFPFLEALEERSPDYRFKLRGRLKPPGNIVIVAIDEKSIERFGRWPWTRDIMARLVDRLDEASRGI